MSAENPNQDEVINKVADKLKSADFTSKTLEKDLAKDTQQLREFANSKDKLKQEAFNHALEEVAREYKIPSLKIRGWIAEQGFEASLGKAVGERAKPNVFAKEASKGLDPKQQQKLEQFRSAQLKAKEDLIKAIDTGLFDLPAGADKEKIKQSLQALPPWQVNKWWGLFSKAESLMKYSRENKTAPDSFVMQAYAKLLEGKLPEAFLIKRLIQCEDGLKSADKSRDFVLNMLSRMIPGVNIYKDGLWVKNEDGTQSLNWEALKADGVNVIAVAAMIASAGLSSGVVAGLRLGVTGMKVARGVMVADAATTTYFTMEGGANLYEAYQHGDEDAMALNAAMTVMGVLGARASVKAAKGASKQLANGIAAEAKTGAKAIEKTSIPKEGLVDPSVSPKNGERLAEPKSKPVREKVSPETLERNGKLDNVARITEAEKLLGRELKPEQRKALIDAHEIGAGSKGKYTQAEITEKARILKEAGFTEAERRQLMQNGLAGEADRMVGMVGAEKIVNQKLFIVGDIIKIKDASGFNIFKVTGVIVRGPNAGKIIVECIESPNSKLKGHKGILRSGIAEGEVFSFGPNHDIQKTGVIESSVVNFAQQEVAPLSAKALEVGDVFEVTDNNGKHKFRVNAKPAGEGSMVVECIDSPNKYLKGHKGFVRGEIKEGEVFSFGPERDTRSTNQLSIVARETKNLNPSTLEVGNSVTLYDNQGGWIRLEAISKSSDGVVFIHCIDASKNNMLFLGDKGFARSNMKVGVEFTFGSLSESERVKTFPITNIEFRQTTPVGNFFGKYSKEANTMGINSAEDVTKFNQLLSNIPTWVLEGSEKRLSTRLFDLNGNTQALKAGRELRSEHSAIQAKLNYISTELSARRNGTRPEPRLKRPEKNVSPSTSTTATESDLSKPEKKAPTREENSQGPNDKKAEKNKRKLSEEQMRALPDAIGGLKFLMKYPAFKFNTKRDVRFHGYPDRDGSPKYKIKPRYFLADDPILASNQILDPKSVELLGRDGQSEINILSRIIGDVCKTLMILGYPDYRPMLEPVINKGWDHALKEKDRISLILNPALEYLEKEARENNIKLRE